MVQIGGLPSGLRLVSPRQSGGNGARMRGLRSSAEMFGTAVECTACQVRRKAAHRPEASKVGHEH
eukprot:7445871-Pyramimonas_sp.AAC.1